LGCFAARDSDESGGFARQMGPATATRREPPTPNPCFQGCVPSDQLWRTLEKRREKSLDAANSVLAPHLASRIFYLRARVKAYSVSPAPTIRYCLPSSIQVDGPLLTA